jgi:hypothetical protein
MSRMVPERVRHTVELGAVGLGLGAGGRGERSMSDESGDSSSTAFDLRAPASLARPPPGSAVPPEMTSNLGTTAWCAPELLAAADRVRYGVKVDVYRCARLSCL